MESSSPSRDTALAMSEENVEIVRQRLSAGSSNRRRLQERLFLRLPRATARLNQAILRRRPSSRLRQTMLRRAATLSFEALNRGDVDAAFALVPPDFEAVPAPEAASMGLDTVYHGREGRVRYHQQWIAELGDFQNRPEEIIDLGDRVLVLGQIEGTGAASGAPFEEEVAYLVTILDGRMVREQDFRSHQEGREAAGLLE